MSKKYFKGRVYREDRMCPFVVWDVEHEYRSRPPPELLPAEGFEGDVYIAQVNKAVGRDFLRKMPFAGLIIWASDSAVYRATIKKLAEQASVRMQ
jgi:hypothetical protein